MTPGHAAPERPSPAGPTNHTTISTRRCTSSTIYTASRLRSASGGRGPGPGRARPSRARRRDRRRRSLSCLAIQNSPAAPPPSPIIDHMHDCYPHSTPKSSSATELNASSRRILNARRNPHTAAPVCAPAARKLWTSWPARSPALPVTVTPAIIASRFREPPFALAPWVRCDPRKVL